MYNETLNLLLLIAGCVAIAAVWTFLTHTPPRTIRVEAHHLDEAGAAEFRASSPKLFTSVEAVIAFVRAGTRVDERKVAEVDAYCRKELATCPPGHKTYFTVSAS